MASQVTPTALESQPVVIEPKVDLTISETPTLCVEGEEWNKLGKDDASELIEAVKTPTPASENQLTPLRRNLILLILCLAQFFDIFNAASAIVSLPKISEDLQFSAGTIQWILSAYSLTFAAFMLVAGRIADIIHPKPVFTIGFLVIGLLAIPVGASVNPIMAIIFRAIQGIGAAMNIPSAMALINMNITDPNERSRAYAIFGGVGAIGNVCGLVIGGVLTAQASWRWVFYLLAIAVTPLAAISWFILPPHKKPELETPRSIDWAGVSSLTAGLILFVFALTEGSAAGWGSARVIATLVLSVVLLGAFGVIERIVKDPAFPSRTWTNKNFTPMFFYAWSIYWYVFVVEMQLVEIFNTLWGDSALIAAVRCVPMGLSAGISTPLASYVTTKVPRRIVLIGGQVLALISVILFALADTKDKYWSHVVPGMIIGMVGLIHSYVGCTTVVMDGARKGEEGVVGAVMNTAYQVGATIGLAIATSITLAVNDKQALDAVSQHKGYEISFWSVLGLNGLMALITLLFVKN
ncbi:major facilitator superfamily domain-containing protein [Cyathus striatus]|nr:major facilitator superfamily domain-containing protein [Cyathus striatus]